MMETQFRGKTLLLAAAAVILLLTGAVSVRSEEHGSIRLLFTGGVTAHLEPSG